MWKDFSDENEAKDFAKKVGGTYRKSKTTPCWVVIWDETKFDLRHFIKHCLADEEFWERGGIPTKEKYYIKKLQIVKAIITESFVGKFVASEHIPVTTPVKNDKNLFILKDQYGSNRLWQVCEKVSDYAGTIVPHLYRVREIGILFD